MQVRVSIGNPSITDTFGEQLCFGLYTEVAFVEGLFCTQTVHLGPGCLAVIIIAVDLYSEVVVNRGSTVYSHVFLDFNSWICKRMLCSQVMPTWNAIAAFSEECIEKLVHAWSVATPLSSYLCTRTL